MRTLCQLLIVFIQLNVLEAIINCQENITAIRLCQIPKTYNNGEPPMSNGRPMSLKQSLTLLSVAEFDVDQNTLSLVILLAVQWNDTRIKLKLDSEEK